MTRRCSTRCPRWVRADVLATGDLIIGGRVVPGEGERARTVQEMLLRDADRAELADAGVGWVVVESPSGPTAYRVGGDHPAASGRGIVLAAHLAWLGLLFAGLVGMLIGNRRRGQRAAPATSD